MRWFKHMAASWDDEKLAALVDQCGLEGYGFWWRVVEIVAAKVDKSEQTSAEFPPKKWGSLLGLSPKKFRTLAELCANLGLFMLVFSENSISINMPNILKFRDEYTERESKKSGVHRDKLPPSRARVPETDTDTETDIPPLPPTRGCAVPDADPALSGPALSDPADMDRGFHEFMAAYPADHRAPEAEAAAAWKKLARAKKLPGLPRLFQGLDEWEACAQWKKNGGEFIPKAANFLRHMMWQDIPPVGLRTPSKARAPTPWQQNIADKDDLAKALLAERYGEKNNENIDFTQTIDIKHRVRNPDNASAIGLACR